MIPGLASSAVAVLLVATAVSADLRPKTVAAFDRYVRISETRMERSEPFLRLDQLSADRRAAEIERVRRGELFIDRLITEDAGKEIEVPDGIIHHWVGAVFVPAATVDQAVALLQSYDRHSEIYRPAVTRSKLISRDGDNFRFALRFKMQKVITVVVNTENEARYTRGPDRAQSLVHSTRIAEVDNPDTANEAEKPVGRDGGYLWRLNTYWRFLQRDGGTYVQCESITLSRGIPLGFGWLIGPFVTSVPRESLAFTLEATRRALTKPQ
jgi:hypothetical protein